MIIQIIERKIKMNVKKQAPFAVLDKRSVLKTRYWTCPQQSTSSSWSTSSLVKPGSTTVPSRTPIICIICTTCLSIVLQIRCVQHYVRIVIAFYYKRTLLERCPSSLNMCPSFLLRFCIRFFRCNLQILPQPLVLLGDCCY